MSPISTTVSIYFTLEVIIVIVIVIVIVYISISMFNRSSKLDLAKTSSNLREECGKNVHSS